MTLVALAEILITRVVLAGPARSQQSADAVNSRGQAITSLEAPPLWLACAHPTRKAAISGDRFINCGDGTLVDRTTGLIWELKDTACVTGDLHCVNTT